MLSSARKGVSWKKITSEQPVKRFQIQKKKKKKKPVKRRLRIFGQSTPTSLTPLFFITGRPIGTGGIRIGPAPHRIDRNVPRMRHEYGSWRTVSLDMISTHASCVSYAVHFPAHRNFQNNPQLVNHVGHFTAKTTLMPLVKSTMSGDAHWHKANQRM